MPNFARLEGAASQHVLAVQSNARLFKSLKQPS
jgi:hypothetical protein